MLIAISLSIVFLAFCVIIKHMKEQSQFSGQVPDKLNDPEKSASVQSRIIKSMAKIAVTSVFFSTYSCYLPTPYVRDDKRIYQEITAMPSGDQPEEVTLDVYRINNTDPKDISDRKVSDSYITEEIKQASDSMMFNLQETGSNLVVKNITDLVHEPTAIESRNGKACYSVNDTSSIEEIASSYHEKGIDRTNKIVLVLDDIDVCRSNEQSLLSSAAAYFRKQIYAPDILMFTRYGSENTTFLGRSVFAHEYGHAMGLPHEGRVTCNPVNFPRGEKDYQPDYKIVSYSDGCDAVRGDDGKVNAYSSNRTIMAGRPNNYDFIDSSMDGVIYSTLDRKIASPSSFNFAKGNLDEKSQYSLSAGKDKLNGVYFPIEENNPLKRLDPSLTKIVVAAEKDFVNLKDDKDSQWTSCSGGGCAISVTATNPDYSIRYQLDTMSYPIDSNKLEDYRPLYSDGILNIGVRYLSDGDEGYDPKGSNIQIITMTSAEVSNYINDKLIARNNLLVKG